MKRTLWQDLKSLRDELKVQSHLFSLETKEKWNLLEQKFTRANSKLEKAFKVTGDTGEDIKVMNEMMLEDLKESYRKIKATLKA